MSEIEDISNVLTPSKKRKRNFDSFAFWSNSAEIPSSTPITSADKSLAKASFENPSFKGSNKENNFNFMEHKSLGEGFFLMHVYLGSETCLSFMRIISKNVLNKSMSKKGIADFLIL